MSMLEHTVFDWCGPFVTDSLLFDAPVRHQASASSCGVVLCSPQVSAGVLLRAADCDFQAVSVAQPVSEMATGSGRQDADPDPVRLYAHRSSMTWTRIVSRMCWAYMPAARTQWPVPNGRVHPGTMLIISGWFIRCPLL